MAISTTRRAAKLGVNWRVLERCPDCAAQSLSAVFDGESTNFLCRSCNRCWHAELGWIRRVDPLTCPGCDWQPVCSSRVE